MIRQAKITDAKRVIELLNLALEDVAFVLSGTEDVKKSDEILRSFFINGGNRLGFENIYVYEINGVIAGVVCAYFGGDLERLDEPILAHLRKFDKNANLQAECFSDEFYIDSIAVDEKFRKQGIAKELIIKIFKVAREKNIKKVSLIVSEKKPIAREFYERLGFKKNIKMIINFNPYDHMIKEII